MWWSSRESVWCGDGVPSRCGEDLDFNLATGGTNCFWIELRRLHFRLSGVLQAGRPQSVGGSIPVGSHQV